LGALRTDEPKELFDLGRLEQRERSDGLSEGGSAVSDGDGERVFVTSW
jgi:hypothetical protein